MSGWLLATLGLLPVLVAAVVAAGRGAVPGRLVAVQLALSATVLLLMLFEFAIRQPSSLDLALALALLGLPGTLVLVLFQERWL
ncbi:MAG TPA: monovalent cation/H+ antiporter complex subunit F [Gammaproteobacteria bacterium]|nr:monovalent cation/H+ antiporter complex subunit F [Gammaproteobacteria bacterium]